VLFLLACAQPTLSEDDARLAAAAHLDGEAGLAWQDEGVWEVLVRTHDWRTHRVRLGEYTTSRDLTVHALGRVYEESPVQGEPIEVELLTDAEVLENDVVVAYTILFDDDDAMDAAHFAQADEAGDFLYDPDEPSLVDPFAEVQAFHHVAELEAHAFERWGVEFPEGIDAFVNYREHPDGYYGNAWMSIGLRGETVLVFGQGETLDFAYDGDVIAHEFGHGVLFAGSPIAPGYGSDDAYGRNIYTSAVSEGFADYYAAAWFDDSLVGDYFGGRDVDVDLVCPDDGVGESHQDGLILAGALWALRVELGADFDDVVMAAIARFPPTPDFSEVATILVEEAEAYGWAARTEEVLTDRGLFACSRLVELPDALEVLEPVPLFQGQETLEAEICEQSHADGFRRLHDKQLVYTFPEREAVSLDVAIDWQRFDGEWVEGEQDWSLYVRAGERVTFAFEDTGQGPPLAVPDGYDLELGPGDEWTTLEALEPGGLYYFALSHMNCAASDLAITATAAIPIHEPPETKGCGCGTGSAPWALGLLGLLLARRR